MTAPSYTARGDLTGSRPMTDGYRALMTLAADASVLFWEKVVTPPGLEGGDAIDQTTMHNDDWRTVAPRSLKTLTEMQMTAAYNPASYDSIIAVINVETTISILFSTGNYLAFYGYLRNFQPADLSEGAQPECTITVVPTNWDPVANSEEAPVYGTP